MAGAAVNWAVYALAWNRRQISPWSPPAQQAPLRRLGDRVPAWGWLGLRREESLHGRGFWLRPLAVELLMGAGFAALWWWEVDRQGLVAAQFSALPIGGLPMGMLVAPAWNTYATFASHALLVSLMAAASLIDIDEKTIPDDITVPGTLIALMLATFAPASLLPQVAIRSSAPAAVVLVPLPDGLTLDEGAVYVEPTTLVAPTAWPTELRGAPEWLGLAIGLACFWLWCFALTPRDWRGRRGACTALAVLLARARRELARSPLVWIALAGTAFIVAVWWRGGAAWVGLLTALVGMIGGGAMVWAIRIVGSAALRREALGFGDVTLMMMVGAFLGWQAGVIAFFLSPFAALAVGVLQMVLRRNDEIFYGPFLCLATLAVMVRWGSFWNVDSPLPQICGEGWLVPVVLAVGVVLLGAMLVIWRNIKEALFQRAND
jgi:leader peptidase (prepilin peptidase) / N-methyltransferase